MQLRTTPVEREYKERIRAKKNGLMNKVLVKR
jgi:hypothetical protein